VSEIALRIGDSIEEVGGKIPKSPKSVNAGGISLGESSVNTLTGSESNIVVNGKLDLTSRAGARYVDTRGGESAQGGGRAGRGEDYWGSSLTGLRTRDPPLGPPSTLAEIFRNPCLQSHLQTSPPTPQKSYPKFWNPRKTFEMTPLDPPNI
jgi:hypothetical protein